MCPHTSTYHYICVLIPLYVCVQPSKHDTFHINIAGKVYDIPYSDWYITQVCLKPSQ